MSPAEYIPARIRQNENLGWKGRWVLRFHDGEHSGSPIRYPRKLSRIQSALPSCEPVTTLAAAQFLAQIALTSKPNLSSKPRFTILPSVNASSYSASMAKKSVPSPKPKAARSWQPRPLTPEEIALLRSDAKATAAESRQAWARLRPRQAQQ